MMNKILVLFMISLTIIGVSGFTIALTAPENTNSDKDSTDLAQGSYSTDLSNYLPVNARETLPSKDIPTENSPKGLTGLDSLEASKKSEATDLRELTSTKNHRSKRDAPKVEIEAKEAGNGEFEFDCGASGFEAEEYEWDFGYKKKELKSAEISQKFGAGEFEITCTAKNDGVEVKETIKIVVEEKPSIKLVAPESDSKFAGPNPSVKFDFMVDHSEKIKYCNVVVSGESSYPYLGNIKKSTKGEYPSVKVAENPLNSLSLNFNNGNYKAQVICADEDGDIGESNIITFSVIDGQIEQVVLPEEEQRSGAGCLSPWICGAWSACSEGQQTRSCELATDPKYYCISETERPAEVQSCETEESNTLENTGETVNAQPLFSRITGAFIGPNGTPSLLGGFLLIGIVAILYIAVYFYRRG